MGFATHFVRPNASHFAKPGYVRRNRFFTLKKDSETDIIEVFDIDELIKELKDNPDKYTNDLEILIPKYEKELRKIIKLIEKKHKK